MAGIVTYIVENTATPPYGGFASTLDALNNWAFYENGLSGSFKGLPQGGGFVSFFWVMPPSMASFSHTTVRTPSS